MANYLENRTQEEQATILASYLPDNAMWAKKNISGSNIRKVLLGLAQEFRRNRDILNEIRDEYFPSTTTKFIENWEKQVGIPDSCIDVAADIEDRRNNVMLKLSGINATTKKEFEDLIAALGIVAVVETGTDTSTLPLSLPFILVSEAEAPFTIVVTLDASLTPSGS